MIIGTLAVLLPLDAAAQTYRTQRVYRNGRWQTVRVYTNNGSNYGSRYRTRGISAKERERLARQRYRLYQQRNRITRDGSISDSEARRLNRSRQKYQRRVNRARNN